MLVNLFTLLLPHHFTGVVVSWKYAAASFPGSFTRKSDPTPEVFK